MSLVTVFLAQLNKQIRHQEGDSLAAWLQVAPEAGGQYHQLAAELRSRYRDNDILDRLIEKHLPDSNGNLQEGQGAPFSGFRAFVKDYLVFWRDVDYEDLLGAHELLSTVVNSCATAFANPQGAVLLKTSMALSETLARLTMMLNRRPDLLRRVKREAAAGDDSQKSLAEKSAETIQRIFKTCLQDRTTDRYTAPAGTKVAVYKFANLVLKLLFACRRTQLATMLLTQIESQGPLLSLYPAAQRVTFLYYLGRYWLSNNHFLRAAHCLQDAYLQTPPQFASHRTKILTYLIPCNLLLGRFPSAALMARPESNPLAPIFLPLCAAVRAGNFVAFQAHLAAHEDWLFRRGLLLTLTHKLRPLLWRSLSRKTFMLTYSPPADASSRRAATLDISHLHAAAVYLQRRLEGWLPHASTPHRSSATANPLLMRALKSNTQPPDDTTLAPPPGGPRRLRPNEGMVWGNAEVTLDDVEMMVAELVQQGLMHGFIAHGQGRFAIIGAKARGPVVAGWPNVWQAIRERRYEGEFDPDEVPGWVHG